MEKLRKTFKWEQNGEQIFILVDFLIKWMDIHVQLDLLDPKSLLLGFAYAIWITL